MFPSKLDESLENWPYKPGEIIIVLPYRWYWLYIPGQAGTEK